jgi:hypothetical protein
MQGLSGEELVAICAVLRRIVENVERLAADDPGAAARARSGTRPRRRTA